MRQNTYVVYERNESGILTRRGDIARIRSPSRKEYYPYREPLTGWPEKTVYWEYATGVSFGVAPR